MGSPPDSGSTTLASGTGAIHEKDPGAIAVGVLPQPFPWSAAMAFGLGRLRLASADFWRLTPRELAAAIEGHFGTSRAPMARATFAALTARYPDKKP